MYVGHSLHTNSNECINELDYNILSIEDLSYKYNLFCMGLRDCILLVSDNATNRITLLWTLMSVLGDDGKEGYTELTVGDRVHTQTLNATAVSYVLQ